LVTGEDGRVVLPGSACLYCGLDTAAGCGCFQHNMRCATHLEVAQ
jgi:hypothetical protein